MWQQAPGGWIWWWWNPRHHRWEQSWYADVPVVQWQYPVEIQRPASPKAGRRRRSRSRQGAQAPVTPPRRQPVTPPKAKATPHSIRVQKPKINPDDEVVYVRVPFSLKDSLARSLRS
jgi:hypothetical protein